jgi:AbrB family looped-hinge helix DNA binding protein
MATVIAESTVTSKGQITIPVQIRRALGLHAGSKLEFIADGPNSARFVCKATNSNSLPAWQPPSGVHLSIDEMDEVIANAALDANGLDLM